MSFYYKRLAKTDGPTELHSIMDHAIDRDASDPQKYVETLMTRHLRPKAGERLARFEVRPLSRRQYEDIEMEAGARGAALGLENVSVGTLLALRLFDACCVAAHDVWLDDDEAYGTVTGEMLQHTSQLVRMEIGGYCRKLYGEMQPDFFGRLRSQRSSEEAAQDASGEDGHSPAETASDTPRTDES